MRGVVQPDGGEGLLRVPAALGAAAAGAPQRERDVVADAQPRVKRPGVILEHHGQPVGLDDTAHRYPWQLSGGMQQRVAIARAIACDPVLLLMDEPFGSVDAQTREDLEDLVLRLRRDRGITILLVTHDIDESVYTGDRVIVLTGAPGRVRADLAVQFPEPRDQITTKELPAFVQLRTEVSRLIRGQQATADR